MKRAVRSACLAFIAFIAAFPIAAQDSRGLSLLVKKLDPGFRAGKQYLLLIAVDNYQNWPALKNPVRDAKEIKELIASRYYVDEATELYNDKATKAGILKAFEAFQKKLTVNDSLLVYYAGHGHLDAMTNTGFWIPVNAGLDKYEQGNWLPNTQIRGIISSMKSIHLLVISDSCFSGDLLNSSRAMPDEINNDYFKKAYARISRQILTSGASEAVPDESEFSRMLKLALMKNNNPYFDPLMLYNEVRLGVRGSMPLFGNLKDTGHQEGASFLLFLKEEPPREIVTVEPKKEEPKKEEPKKPASVTPAPETKPAKSEDPVMIELNAGAAKLIPPDRLRLMNGAVTQWRRLDEIVQWTCTIPSDGEYVISIRYACYAPDAGATVKLSVDDQFLQFVVRETGSWDIFMKSKIGSLALRAGTRTLKFQAVTPSSGGFVMSLEQVILERSGPLSKSGPADKTQAEEKKVEAAKSDRAVTINLIARDAELVTKSTLRRERIDFIGGWTSVDDQVKWNVVVPEDGIYTVSVRYAIAARNAGSVVSVSVGGQSVDFTVRDTGSLDSLLKVAVGKLALKAGGQTVSVKAKNKTAEYILFLSEVLLEKQAGRTEVEKKDGTPSAGRPVTLTLTGLQAQLESPGLNLKRWSNGNITLWTSVNDRLKWLMEVPEEGEYEVAITYSCQTSSFGSRVRLSVGDKTMFFSVKDTSGIENFNKFRLGRMKLPAGKHVVVLQATDIQSNGVVMTFFVELEFSRP